MQDPQHAVARADAILHGTGPDDGFLILARLQFGHRHFVGVLDLVGQAVQLIRLHAPERKGRLARLRLKYLTPQRLKLFRGGGGVGLFETLARSQLAWPQDISDRPQVLQAVFHRRAGHPDAHPAIQGSGRTRHLAGGVFQLLNLIESDDAKFRLCEAEVEITHRLVGREDDVGVRPPRTVQKVLSGRCIIARTVTPAQAAEVFAESLNDVREGVCGKVQGDFPAPICQQSGRRDNQGRLPVLAARGADESQHLKCFAKPHIIGQQYSRQAPGKRRPHPANAFYLVRFQRRFKASKIWCSEVLRGHWLNASHCLEVDVFKILMNGEEAFLFQDVR